MKLANLSWKKYLFELITIILGVSIAFALDSWGDDRRDRRTEEKILMEIHNGLTLDLEDIEVNMKGHELGMESCDYFRKILLNCPFERDSFMRQYFLVTRDFISIQNSSAYEALKSRGLEMVDNDSLRLKIIAVYDFYFETIKKLEEEYHEMQFNDNYFQYLNRTLSPYYIFNEEGKLTGIGGPIELSSSTRNELLSYLMKIEFNRKFILMSYDDLKKRILDLKGNIEEKLRL